MRTCQCLLGQSAHAWQTLRPHRLFDAQRARGESGADVRVWLDNRMVSVFCLM
jgi:hypothetical protein